MNLYHALLAYQKSNLYPFHMPGHKRNPAFFPNHLFALDFTEIEGLDNLQDPTGVIQTSQEMFAGVFGASASFLLVNGSSSGIIAAIMTVCRDGDCILAGRNSHLSFFSALAYAGAVPIYVQPDITADHLIGGIEPTAIEEALRNNEKIKAVFVTSPTYEGFTSDIQTISEIVHRHNGILIVDEAHGAHFSFSPYFPKSALQQGADIVVQSLHKTLPTLGQTALLHVAGERIDQERLKQHVRFVQTSSPSYLLMGMADKCVSDLKDNPAMFERYITVLQTFRRQCAQLKNLSLLGREVVGQNAIHDVDLGKLVFLGWQSGTELERILREQYKIQLEMSTIHHCIAMTSVADTKEGFDRLFSALADLDQQANDFQRIVIPYPKRIPELVHSARESLCKKTKRVKLVESVGCVSAENITPYPPGIPLLTMGERITQELIEYVMECRRNEISIMGRTCADEDFIMIQESV